MVVENETDQGRRWSGEIDEHTGRRRSIVVREHTPKTERLAAAIVEVERWFELAGAVLDFERARATNP